MSENKQRQIVYRAKDGSNKKTTLSRAELEVLKQTAKDASMKLNRVIEAYVEYRATLIQPQRTEKLNVQEHPDLEKYRQQRKKLKEKFIEEVNQGVEETKQTQAETAIEEIETTDMWSLGEEPPEPDGYNDWETITINKTEIIRVRRNETKQEKAYREYREALKEYKEQ